MEQAIESILMQQTNFDWKLVIADDCSKDQTRSIILRYKEKFPDKIHLIFQEKNTGPAQNFLDLIAEPKSKYIAYLEGDDYWTDPLKLQKQVDFLEKNPEFSFCFHDINQIDSKGTLVRERCLGPNSKRELDIKKILSGARIPTLTVVFRNFDTLVKTMSRVGDVVNGDTFLFLCLAKNGNAAFLDNVIPANYRVHDGGVWSLKSKLNKFIGSYRTFIIILNEFPEYSTLIQKKIISILLEIRKLDKDFYHKEICKYNFFLRMYIYGLKKIKGQ